MRSPSVGRIGQAGGDDVPRRDLHPADPDLLGPVEAELVQRLQDLDELVAEAVLEGHPPGLHPARDEEDLLVLDVHALDRADALGEVEDLRLARTAAVVNQPGPPPR